MEQKIQQAEIIIRKAIEQYRPKKFVLMVSGGHDSITNAHVAASILKEKGIEFVVYHGDTTIGIMETQQYVKRICELYGWTLSINKPPKEEDHYKNIVARWGFPGSTKRSHQLMYRRLKERALRRFVTYDCKTSVHARENVLLISGVRKQESKIRMGYKHVTSKDGSMVWCNPIFLWLEEDCKNYMDLHSIPHNPVKDTIGISGECLCGAFATKPEYDAIKKHFPNTGKMLDELAEIAKANGHDWEWWSNPTQYKKDKANNIQCKINFMCASCGD